MILLGIIGFGLQHSGISATPIKKWTIEKWGKGPYSLIFNGTAVFMLLVTVKILNFSDWLYFVKSSTAIQWHLFVPGMVLISLGIIVGAAASTVISVSTIADMRTKRQDNLVTQGIYAQIRHPLYLAALLLFIGMALVYPLPEISVFSSAFCGYILLGSYLEERKLIEQYGQAYITYRKKTGFLFPKF